jgi:protein-disulfide isomerase
MIEPRLCQDSRPNPEVALESTEAAVAAPAPNAKTRVAAALLLCAAAAAVAALLLLQHHGEPRAVSAVSQACGDGQTSGCDDVARSRWSRVAGWPVAAWGLAFYLSVSLLLFLALAGPESLAWPLALVGAGALVSALLVDLVLLGVQAFSIRAFCWLCVSTYVLGGLALAALWPARRASARASAAFAAPEGRLALAGLLAGAAAVLAFVFAANAMLVQRAAHRQANLLGSPSGPVASASPQLPTAAPAESATEATAAPAPEAVSQDANYWRDQAKKLQATIDDPAKLEAYFATKAQAEYDSAKVESIDLSRGPLKGAAGAHVTVVEYSDFLCPYCRQLAVGLSGFVPQAGGRVAVYFKNFPLDNSCNPKLQRAVHPGSCTLALGAICAQNQGKLEAYHDRVFGSELRNPGPADVVRLAGEAGLNAAALEGCLDDPQTKAALAAEIAEGNRLAVHSTPTVYINGKKLPRLNDFLAVVDKEAQKKGSPPMGR